MLLNIIFFIAGAYLQWKFPGWYNWIKDKVTNFLKA
jgi:hypothetical protein